MTGLQRVVTSERIYAIGDLFKACTGRVCHIYFVKRVRLTREGFVNELRQVSGSRSGDPMISYYDELREQAVERKEAVRLARLKFDKSESTFYRRLRSR